jgi:hypothetical protein
MHSKLLTLITSDNAQTSLQQDIYDRELPNDCRPCSPYTQWQCIITCKQGAEDRCLLQGMHHTTEAGYRSGNREGCLRGTRRDVLLQLKNWLEDKQDQHVFWLNGLAGTGKSTIAQTFAEITFAEGKTWCKFLLLTRF